MKSFSRDPRISRRKRSLPRQGTLLFALLIVLSFLVHALSIENMGAGQWPRLGPNDPLNKPTNVRIVVKSAPLNAKEQRVLEARQRPTLPPADARFLAEENHIAKKETRTRVRPNRDDGNGKAPGPLSPPPSAAHKDQNVADRGMGNIIPKPGELRSSDSRRPEGGGGSMYRDALPSDLDIGDAVDLNTSEFRYVGYFTHLRRALYLVWNYPVEAQRRGLTGAGLCLFRINANGDVDGLRLIRSTGSGILDNAFKRAVLEAQFPPLPKTWGQKSLTIAGEFQYGG